MFSLLQQDPGPSNEDWKERHDLLLTVVQDYHSLLAEHNITHDLPAFDWIPGMYSKIACA